MRSLPILVLALTAAIASPASAAVVGAENVSLSSSPTTFNFGAASFGFTYDAAAASSFDPTTYFVQTTGTGQTSAFGGFLGIPLAPSLFDQRGITIDGNLFPTYASFPTLSGIGASLVPGDLALRYAVGSDYFYGYARLNGNGTLNLAFENSANTAITAGAAITGPLAAAAVPEPATWALMLMGFGAIGVAMRRRERSVLATA